MDERGGERVGGVADRPSARAPSVPSLSHAAAPHPTPSTRHASQRGGAFSLSLQAHTLPLPLSLIHTHLLPLARRPRAVGDRERKLLGRCLQQAADEGALAHAGRAGDD